MKHNSIHNQLLAYLDGEITGRQATLIRQHLQECEICRAVAELWREERQQSHRVSASPYLWTRIQRGLQQPARGEWFDRTTASRHPILQPAVAIALFVFVVFTGIQIGEEIVTGVPQQSAQIRQEFRMDYFAAVPSGSIGEVLVSPENDGRKVSP